jgi:hypothetical protein
MGNDIGDAGEYWRIDAMKASKQADPRVYFYKLLSKAK